MGRSWRPVADLQLLRRRAQLLADIRCFFVERGVWEVETPLLCRATGTDPNLDFFASRLHSPPQNPTLFLQTSPEFAMKRLLAAGSGSIFQICKAFRNGEVGRFHNPEFTILEWYRVGYDLQQLMAEVAELLLLLLSPQMPNLRVEHISYRQIFHDVTGLDALVFRRSTYRQFAESRGLAEADRLCADEHALWLDLLFSHCVQNALPDDAICLVHAYPAIQSSLARIDPHDDRVAQRFEVFFRGMELGNGFYELCDAGEQADRFEREIAQRQAQGLPAVAIDRLFLQALQSGLPDCSGIAIGIDRLMMLIAGAGSIEEVMAFPFANA